MSAECGFSGNSDLYGLGIRLGVYLQWASAGVAYAMNLQGEASSVFEAHIIFTFAIMIALFALTFTTQMHAIEVAIMLYLYFGGLLSIIYYIMHQSPTVRRTWRQFAIVIGWVVTGGYSAWFWLAGRKTSHFVQDGCHTYLFMFAKLGPKDTNGLCRFFGALSIIYGFSFGVYSLPLHPKNAGKVGKIFLHRQMLASISDVQQMGADLRLPADAIDTMVKNIEEEFIHRMARFQTRVSTSSVLERDTSQSPPSRGSITRITKGSQIPPNELAASEFLPHLSLLEIFYLEDPDDDEEGGLFGSAFVWIHAIVSIYSIVGVELMLHWNKVTDVYTIRSVGQLIPFVIGLVGFLKLFFELSIFHKRRDHQKPDQGPEIAHDPETVDRDSHVAESKGTTMTTVVAGSYASMQTLDGKWH